MNSRDRDSVAEFAREASVSAVYFAGILGISEEIFKEDPLIALSAWEDYIDRLPLEEFEASDWSTLRTDIVAFFAEILTRRFDVSWKMIENDASNMGYHYVLARKDERGNLLAVNPFEYVVEQTNFWPFSLSAIFVKLEIELQLIDSSSGKWNIEPG